MAKKEKGYKSALENLIEDKGLDSAIVIEALTEALAKSYKKNYCGTESIVDCKLMVMDRLEFLSLIML